MMRLLSVVFVATVVSMSFLPGSTFAQSKVGLCWPMWDDGAGTSLYYAEIIETASPPDCTDPEPTYYWWDSNAQYCPWEVCDADFQYFMVRNEDKLTTAKAAAVVKRGFDGAFPERIPLTQRRVTQHARFPNFRVYQKPSVPPIPWLPKVGLPEANQSPPHDVKLRIRGLEDPMPVRWFTVLPNRAAALLPAEDIALRKKSLEKPIHVGFQLNHPRPALLPEIPATKHSQSNYQAYFDTTDDDGNPIKVVVITHDRLP